jgi:hypothetical protein
MHTRKSELVKRAQYYAYAYQKVWQVKKVRTH